MAVLLTTSGSTASAGSSAGSAAAAVETFSTPGNFSWVVPAGVTEATFDVYGAQGGTAAVNGGAGGKGGRATATVPLTPGNTLEINVGGAGVTGGVEAGAGAGGYNGGAGGGSANDGYGMGGGGGGASDVRIGPYDLTNRIVVAGGGGGGAGWAGYEPPANAGGSGGGTEGGAGAMSPGDGGPGGGGTQSGGGAGGAGVGSGATGESGSVGLGGAGGGGINDIGSGGGGGGGGGYYGGGGGGGNQFDEAGGGGGGSGYGPSGVVFQLDAQTGNGKVTITYTVDVDGDGVPDDSDNCPSISNPGQEDTDADGTGDVCDADQSDPDEDGVLNASDNCPQVANPGQEDVDEDGIGNVCEPGPHKRSFATFAVRKGSGRLVVPDGFKKCRRFVPVKIQRWTALYDKKGRVVSHAWLKVAGTKTDGTGAYDAAMPKKVGKYRALAPQALLTVNGDEHVCLKSVSATKRM